MLGLLFDEDLELVLEVHDLKEVALDLFTFLQCLLHPLGINPTILILSGYVLSLTELRCDLGDLKLPLRGHLPSILQRGILSLHGLLDVP